MQLEYDPVLLLDRSVWRVQMLLAYIKSRHGLPHLSYDDKVKSRLVAPVPEPKAWPDLQPPKNGFRIAGGQLARACMALTRIVRNILPAYRHQLQQAR
jgi:hypothetical protein